MGRFTLYGLYTYDNTIFDNIVTPQELDKELIVDTIIETSGDLYPYYQVPSRFKKLIENWFKRHEHGFDRMIQALLSEYSPIENYDRYEDSTETPNITRQSTLSGSDKNTLSGSDTSTLSGSDTSTLSGSDTTTLSGTDTNSSSGTDSTSASGKDTTSSNRDTLDTLTEKVSAFDSSSFENSKENSSVGSDDNITEIEYGRSDTTNYGRTDTTSYGRTDTTSYGKTDTTNYGKTDTTNYGKTDTVEYGKVDTERETGTKSFTLHAHGNIGTTQNTEMILNEIELRKFDIYKEIAVMFEHDLLIQVY